MSERGGRLAVMSGLLAIAPGGEFEEILLKSDRSTPFTLSRTSELSILFGLLVVAAILRFYSLGKLPLWLDEVYTYQFSRLPLSKLLSTDVDVHPPLFYIIEKFALLFGRSEQVLRFAPAVFGIAAVYMLHLIGRRFVSPVCGLAAAAVLATSTMHIRYSQEARSYTLLFLELCVAAYGVLKFVEERENGGSDWCADAAKKIKSIATYFIAAALALYTHNISVFYLFALNFAVLIMWWPLKQVDNKNLITWISAQLLLLIIWLPWLSVVIGQAQGDIFSWLAHISLIDALITLLYVYGFSYISSFQPIPNILVFILSLAGLLAAFHRPHRALVVVVGGMLVLLPSVLWAVGFIKPVFMVRTILVCLLGSALGLGMAVAFAQRRVVAVSIMALIIVGNSISTIIFFEKFRKPEWNRVSRMIADRVNMGDIVILCRFYTYWPYRYYQRTFDKDILIAGWVPEKKLLFKVDDKFMAEFLGTSVLYSSALTKKDFLRHYKVKPITDLGASYRKIWLVNSHCMGASEALGARIRKAGFVVQSEEKFFLINVKIFKPSGTPAQ